MPQNAKQKGRLVIFAGCAAALLVGAVGVRADLMVAHGFGQAFGAQGAPLPFDRSAQNTTVSHRVDGHSLICSETEAPAAAGKHLAVGDRITISGRDGRDRVLQVIDLKPVSEPITKIADTAAPPRLRMVTCRLVGAAEGDEQAPLHFIIESAPIETPPALTPSAPKA